MNGLAELIELTREELKEKSLKFTATEFQAAHEIAACIKEKNAAPLLRKLAKEGRLRAYANHFEKLKAKRPEEIAEGLKNDSGKKIFEILFHIHALWTLKNRDPISWPMSGASVRKSYKSPGKEKILTAEAAESMAEFLRSMALEIPHEVTRLDPSIWAEKKRIMPQGLTSLPGPFRWLTTPYLREIIDLFSPSSGTQKVAIMKGAQLGFSVGILENLIGWIIDEEPGPTMFVTADKELAESVVETRVDRMIESAGIQHKIFAQVEKAHGRKTGDTKSKKEFPGGFLLPVGPNVAGKLRSYSIKTVLFDEVDGFPQEVGKEGDPLTLAERRTDAFSRNRKLLYISTPTVRGESRIEPLYLKGDQSKFLVPCKACGREQELTFDRLKFEVDDQGRLVWDSVGFECEGCKATWKNDDKAWFLSRGRWQPTAKPIEPGFRSFHLNSLYSPLGFRPWESIAQEWIQCKSDPLKLRAFVNTVLGETWEERGEAPPYERIMLRREDYLTGRLPSAAKPLLLTLGADVQADRIECELVAWGEGKESWSVGYYVLDGDTNDLQGRAWLGLQDILMKDHAGLPISMALVDAGFRTTTVYQFCEQFSGGVLPCMGESSQAWGRRAFAVRDVPGYSCQRVDIQTGIMKSEIYGYLQREAPADGHSFPSGYCHFPVEYGEKHFKQLTAEQRVKETTRSGGIRWVWKQTRERNEQLDARVYALAGLYVVASLVREMDPDEPISWEQFWEMVKTT
jgi:phage terminase large subunit GpA-like protein